MRSLRLLFLVGLATGFISEKLFVSSQTSSPTADDLYLEGRTSGDLPIDDEDGDDGGSGSGSGDFSSSSFTDTEEIFKFLNVSQTTISKEVVPTEAEPTAESPRSTLTTAADNPHPSTKVKDTETTPFMSPDGDNSNNEVASSTADWFTQNTSPSPSSTSVPPTETTAAKDITVIDHTDGDNSLDTWDVSTPENQGDKVVIKDVENDLQIENRQGRINNVAPEEVTSENMWERTEVLAAVIACGVIGFLCAVFLLLLLAYRMKKKDEGSYDLGDNKVSTTAYHKAPTKEFYA